MNEFTINESEAGQRLDRVVAARLPELSRTRVQELAEAGLAMVEGRAAKPSQRVRAGQRISIQLQPRPALRATPEAIPLEVLYEDDDLLAVNKPAGMTVHAGAGVASGTLVNALLGRGQALSQGGGDLRPGIVHRLDKETSGVILIAKNDFAHAKLAEMFRTRQIEKTYLALVQGALPEKQGRIALAIGRDPKVRVRMTARRAAATGKAREALTEWKTLARVGSTTLAEVRLHTGRTHQIRVHFAAMKHPVVGDTLYGAAARLRVRKVTMPELGRNFLHAAKLGFAHPRSGARLELRAPLPEALRQFLRELAAAAGEDASPDANQIDAALAGYL